MGCPSIYYKICLQNLAHSLVYMENKKLAKELLEEKSEEKLEEFILNKKSEMDEKQFYFEAGCAAQCMAENADKNDGVDGFNAAIGGFSMFESFLGLDDEDE